MKIYITPNKIIFLSLLLYCTLWLVAPLDIVHESSADAIIIMAISYLLLIVSSNVSYLSLRTCNFKVSHLYVQADSNRIYGLFKVIFFLCLISIAMRIADKVFIRDMLQYSSSVERRDADSTSSFLGILSSFFYMLCLTLPIFIKLLDIRFLTKILVVFVFFFPSIEVMWMGSRGIVVTTLFMLGMYCLYWNDWRVKAWHIVLIITLATSVLLVGGMIFLVRIESYGMSPLYSAFNSVYAFTLVPNDEAARLIDSGSAYSFLYFVAINFAQYYLHGFLEFSYLLDNFAGYHHLHGAYTFSVVDKFSAVIFNTEKLDIFQATPRFGTYTTFLGPLWVDFGYYLFLFVFFLGALAGWLQYIVFKGGFHAFPLYAFVLALLFFFPVVNLLQNALGVYVLLAGILFILLCTLYLKVRLRCRPNPY